MDCCDLFKYRKALFVSTASAGCYVFFNIFAMISPWWHQTSQVTVQIRTDSGTESFTGPEVTRTATLVTLDQCRPAYDSFPEICTTTPLDDISAAGDAVDRALWKAGGVGFGIMFVALMVAVATLFVTAAALLGQTHKLKPQFMTTKGSIVFFHVLYCLLCLCGFAAYAGVINDELPDTNITSLRYGFGFGLVIILWLLSMVTAVWVWKTTDLIPASAWIIEEGDAEKGLGDKAQSDVRMFKNPQADRHRSGAGVGAGAGAGRGGRGSRGQEESKGTDTAAGSGKSSGATRKAMPPRKHKAKRPAGAGDAAH